MRVILKAEFLPFAVTQPYAKGFNGRSNKICGNTSCPIPLTDNNKISVPSLFESSRRNHQTDGMASLCQHYPSLPREPMLKVITFGYSIKEFHSTWSLVIHPWWTVQQWAGHGRWRPWPHSGSCPTPCAPPPSPGSGPLSVAPPCSCDCNRKTIIIALYSLFNNNALKNQPSATSPKMKNSVRLESAPSNQCSHP